MASIHHQPYHHSTATTTSSRRPRRHSLDYSSLPSSSSTLKHSTTLHSSSKTPTFSLSATASTTPTSTTPTTATKTTNPFSLDTLERYLSEENFRQADEETRRLLIVLAGEAAIQRGYVFFSEVQFIPKEELKAIDELWLKYSQGRFGYSVQKKIWLKADKDFTKFFVKVCWMKKLDTEILQYNYRAFPNEFIWQINPTTTNNDNNDENSNTEEVAPEGHLPLTNALRGTRLLTMIFSHPAFDEGDDEKHRNEENVGDDGEVVIEEMGKKKSRLATLRDRLFKPNYSF
ncbi:tetrapyrrole-binding protein, chloroplastic [Silene latifolia]|uniref:tetrapyrrole-binding protein, chloroplastic n=1 Tax=Silene latifolia TaxID=37657 RepID=UPI003D788D49